MTATGLNDAESAPKQVPETGTSQGLIQAQNRLPGEQCISDGGSREGGNKVQQSEFSKG